MALPSSITLEEHFTSHASLLAATDPNPTHRFPPRIETLLTDLDTHRLANMDANNVSLQVLSHTPNAHDSPATIAAGNDELAAAIRKHSTRFAGFAQLPMHSPDLAAQELERCVRGMGFMGALVDNHTEGNFYDSAAYDVLWAKCVELDVPMYFHPAWPSKAMEEALYSGGGLAEHRSGPMVATALGAFAFGWHASTATTVLRLLACGVFDRFPGLKIVLGHMGELLPYMFARTERVVERMGLERGFREVMHENVWITSSGMFDVHSLRLVLAVMPRERVLFSVDYPFSDNRLGKEYLERIRDEGILEGDALEDFAQGNARKLLFGKSKKS